MRKFLASIFLLMTLTSQQVAHGADKSKEIADRLKAVADVSSLDVPAGVQPWHWKMDVTLWDVDGKNPQQAGIEVWSSRLGRRKSLRSAVEVNSFARMDTRLHLLN